MCRDDGVPVERTNEYTGYIESRGMVEIAVAFESMLQSYFSTSRDAISCRPSRIFMNVYHDPEIDDYTQPQVTVYFPTSIDDVAACLDLDEYMKMVLAREARDKNEFKARVLEWREFRLLLEIEPGIR